MNICVFGASSAHIDEKYIKAVEELGEKLALRGHSLIYGSGGTGLMGAVARGVKRAGGYTHGIVPSFFRDEGVEKLFPDNDETTYTETMAERKSLMEELADAFIIVPGGVGTFEELFEVITLKQLNRFDKAIVFYDIDGYYDILERFLSQAVEEKFLTESCLNQHASFGSAEEVLDYVENYVPQNIPLSKTKHGE